MKINLAAIPIVLLLIGTALFAQQNPIQIDANGLTQTLTAGGVVVRGQIVKINSAGQVVPVLTTDTSGAIGVAATSQTSAGNGVQVSIAGTPLVQIDASGCVVGNIVSFSTTTSGAGHCASTASGQQVGIAISISSPGSNFWNVALSLGGGGGGLTSNTADGAISPLNFGADFKVRYESDCTFNSTTTVVCPSGNFTAADVGKIEFGTNALQTHGSGSLIAVPVIVPQGTIQSVTNATTVVVSVIANANCTPSSSNLCWFAWGKQDDTAAIASAQTAAWNSGPCLTLQLPAGAAFLSKGGLGALTTSQGNSCTGATDFNQAGPELAGMGQGATVLIPLPSFDFTTCTNGAAANSCFGGAGALRAHDFQINGLGQTLNATTHNNNLFEINGTTTFWNAAICTGGSAANLRLAGFGLLSSSSLIGFIVDGACDADIVNVTNEDFGNLLCQINGTSNQQANISLTGLVCFGGNSGSLDVTIGSGIVSSSSGYYGSCLGSACSNVEVDNASGVGQFNSSADLMFGQGAVSQNVLKVNSTGGTARVNLWGDSILLPTTTAGASQAILAIGAGASQISIGQSLLTATGANNRIFNTAAGNGIFDIGGNTFTNGTLANILTGGVFGTYSITGTPVTAAKLALSAGWGTTAAWTALTGNTQYITGTITASGTGQAANPTITYTFPTPFLVAPTGCFGLQVGGTQAAVANPFTPSALTNTGVTLTYNGTPGAGSTLFVQIQCWSM